MNLLSCLTKCEVFAQDLMGGARSCAHRYAVPQDDDIDEGLVMTYLYIALGGALGSMARYWMQNLVGRYTGNGFPYGTFIVNISGSLAMGLFIGWLASRATSANAQDLRMFVAVGIMGGYTTFSSFSLDAVTLMEEGKWGAFSTYILGSVALSLAGLLAGLRLMRHFA